MKSCEGLTYEEVDVEPVHQGWLTVLNRKVILPDGTTKTFEILSSDDAVFVLPYCTTSKTFTLVKEYYPGPNKWAPGLIAGLYEPPKHSSALEAAKMELVEEAHLIGGEWIQLTDTADNSMPYGKYTTQVTLMYFSGTTHFLYWTLRQPRTLRSATILNLL
eukprot:Lankesteria_metandrocarpae@DN4217_c0_g1_i3.p1